jgi:hypothetical protein
MKEVILRENQIRKKIFTLDSSSLNFMQFSSNIWEIEGGFELSG